MRKESVQFNSRFALNAGELCQRIGLSKFETLKMVDNQPDFVFHKDDGTCFGDVRMAFNAGVRRCGIEKCPISLQATLSTTKLTCARSSAG